MTNNLSKGQKTLLKAINRKEKPSTSEIAESNRVQEHYSSRNTVNTVLKRIEEEHELVKSDKSGRSNTWKLTSKGQRKVEKLLREASKKTEKDEAFFDSEQAIDVWSQYYEEIIPDQIREVELGKSSIHINYEKLEKFDAALADELLIKPDEVIDSAKTALRRIPEISNNESMDVRIENVSSIDTKSISEISSSDLNRLISIEGVLENCTNGFFKLVEADFECQDCHDVYRKTFNEGENLKSPYKCDCGSKKFTVLNKRFENRRYLRVKESPNVRNRDKITVVVDGDLAEDERKNMKATGSGIRITGYIEPYRENKNDDHYKLRLRANNIEILEDKWEDIEISTDEENKILDIAQRDDTKDLLVRSIASEEIDHMELMKEGILVWLLGKTEHGDTHILVVGEPGTGKSHLGRHIEEKFPKVIGTVGTGSTGVGLTATVRRDEITGDFVAEAGQLPMADQGYHITDEFDKIDDGALTDINEALSEGTISLAKANIQTKISAETSEFSISNPENDNFDRHQERYKQIPIPDDKASLKDRYDAIIGVTRSDWNNEEEKEKELEIIDTILGRSVGSDGSSTGSQRRDTVDTDLLIKYVAYAQRLDPKVSDDAQEKMKEIYTSIKEQEGPDQNLWDRRRFVSLLKLSIAYARIDLSDEVAPKHVKQASEFIRRSLSSIDFTIGADDFDELSSSHRNRLQKVKDAISTLSERGDADDAEIQDVIERVDLSEDVAEDVIENLKNKGELFEPEQGRVQTI